MFSVVTNGFFYDFDTHRVSLFMIVSTRTTG